MAYHLIAIQLLSFTVEDAGDRDITVRFSSMEFIPGFYSLPDIRVYEKQDIDS
jgi:hypothetical protein